MCLSFEMKIRCAGNKLCLNTSPLRVDKTFELRVCKYFVTPFNQKKGVDFCEFFNSNIDEH